MAERKRLRNFCFTINNWEKIENLQTMIETLKTKSSYLVFGKEIGKEGTPHLQGYCELIQQCDFNKIASKILEGKGHIENRRGTAQQAADYSKKDGNYEEYGEISKQGKRKDITEAYQAAKEKKTMIEFLETEPNFQALRVYEIVKSVYQEDRRFKPEVIWIYGPTGTGKTRYVHEKEPDLWISGKNLRWWLGYENQEATLFDDFRKDFCTFHELLRILDRYPYTVEVKGGHRKLNSKRMYITSCYPPEEVYETREDVGQLLRRIDHVLHLKDFGSEPVVSEVGGNTNPDFKTEPICYL